MIRLRSVTKRYEIERGSKTVLRAVDLDIRKGETVGVLGKNGAGKSTLIRLLSGAEKPTSGTIQRDMTVSWPLAFTGAFQGSLSGKDNVNFVSRVYAADRHKVMDFVEKFSELGRDLDEPVKTYSTGMAARLAFSLSMAINFDCYLIDEIIAVGDARFHQKCSTELFEKRAAASKIIVSHNPELIRLHCTRVAFLDNARLTSFDDVERGIQEYLSAF